MKKTILMCLVILTLGFAQMAMADTIMFQGAPDGFGPWQAGSGGELTALPTGLITAYVDGYSANTRNQDGISTGTFQTFCLEINEHLDPYSVYNAVLNTKAVEGGVGPIGDEISQGTAWLYLQFATGILGSYDYANAVSRKGSAADLQDTIWWLEGELDKPLNIFTTAVETFFSDEATAKLDNNDKYRVAVLNLTDESGLKQDVLILVPEPGSLMLLGLGLIGLVGIRRFKK